MGAPSEDVPTPSEREERMREALEAGDLFTPEQCTLVARVLGDEMERYEREVSQRLATRFSYLKTRLRNQK